MLRDVRVIVRNGKNILQKLGPVEISGISEDGFVTFNIADYEWQDLCEVGNAKIAVNLELAS